MGLTSSFGKFPVMPVPVFPVGVPFPWVSTSPYPDGTLLCDGSSFSTVTYPELAVVFPTGILPDLRGVALRGRDNGKGLDVDGASRAVGSYQADELKSHFHTNGGPDWWGSTTYGEGTGLSSSGVTGYTGGTETRMKNIAVDWLVYAETIAYDLTLNQGNALTLGGYSASYFASLSSLKSDATLTYDSAHSFTSNGYQKLTNGLIIQWGSNTATVSHGTYVSPSFPIAFPNEIYQVVAVAGNTVRTDVTVVYCPVSAITLSGFTYQYGAVNGGAYENVIRYMAIGR